MNIAATLAVAAWIAIAYFSPREPPVSRFRLDSLLPEAPPDWRAGRLEGGNPSSREGTFGVTEETSSFSRRTYERGTSHVTVEIWDWGGDYPYHLPIDVPGWMNGEAVRAGAAEARLRFDTDSRSGRLRVRYLDRFYIVVEGEDIARQEFESWYRRVDLEGLRRELAALRAPQK